MNKLGDVRNMAITEPIRYGELMAALPGSPPAREVLQQYAAAKHPVPVRLTALGYYLDQGTLDQLPVVEPYATDTARVPECAPDAEGCEWRCEVVAAGERLVKPVQSVGDFVEYCVKPAMLQRPAATSAGPKLQRTEPRGSLRAAMKNGIHAGMS